VWFTEGNKPNKQAAPSASLILWKPDIHSRGAWRALQQALSFVFAICCVNEVAPPFISVVLEGLEHEVRAGQKGLWADPHPVPLWEWR